MKQNKVYTTMEEIEKDFFPNFYINELNSVLVENPEFYPNKTRVRCPYCGSLNDFMLKHDIFILCKHCGESFGIEIKKIYKITSHKRIESNEN